MRHFSTTIIAMLSLAPVAFGVTVKLPDCRQLFLVDLTGDDLADYLIVGSMGIRVNASTPDGSVESPAAWTSPDACVDSVGWGDVDDDGFVDIAYGCAADSLATVWFGPFWDEGLSIDTDDRERCGASVAVGDVLPDLGDELVIGCPGAVGGDRGEFRIYSLFGRVVSESLHNVNGSVAGSEMGSFVGTGLTRGPGVAGAWYGVAPGAETCAVVHVAP